MAGGKLLGLFTQRPGRDVGGGLKQFCSRIDRVGTGALGGVAKHSGVLDVQLAHREAASHVRHLRDLLTGLDGALRVLLAHTRPVEQRSAA